MKRWRSCRAVPGSTLCLPTFACRGSLDGIDLARIVCSNFPSIDVLLTSGHLRSAELDERIKGFFFPKPCEGAEVGCAYQIAF